MELVWAYNEQKQPAAYCGSVWAMYLSNRWYTDAQAAPAREQASTEHSPAARSTVAASVSSASSTTASKRTSNSKRTSKALPAASAAMRSKPDMESQAPASKRARVALQPAAVAPDSSGVAQCTLFVPSASSAVAYTQSVASGKRSKSSKKRKAPAESDHAAAPAAAAAAAAAAQPAAANALNSMGRTEDEEDIREKQRVYLQQQQHLATQFTQQAIPVPLQVPSTQPSPPPPAPAPFRPTPLEGEDEEQLLRREIQATKEAQEKARRVQQLKEELEALKKSRVQPPPSDATPPPSMVAAAASVLAASSASSASIVSGLSQSTATAAAAASAGTVGSTSSGPAPAGDPTLRDAFMQTQSMLQVLLKVATTSQEQLQHQQQQQLQQQQQQYQLQVQQQQLLHAVVTGLKPSGRPQLLPGPVFEVQNQDGTYTQAPGYSHAGPMHMDYSSPVQAEVAEGPHRGGSTARGSTFTGMRSSASAASSGSRMRSQMPDLTVSAAGTTFSAQQQPTQNYSYQFGHFAPQQQQQLQQHQQQQQPSQHPQQQ